MTSPIATPEAKNPLEKPEPLEIFVEQMTLYHGSATPGIDQLIAAENDTVGKGSYFVDIPEDAEGYAMRSSKRDHRHRIGVVYEAELSDARICNLDNPEKLAEIMDGYSQDLKHLLLLNPDMSWIRRGVIDYALEAISKKVEPGSVKLATQNNGRLFSEYLKDLGYDGLKTREGGEPPYVGPHHTYLIFDPDKVQLISEKALTQS